MRLLVTDLDNTLYDWVTFFARSVRAMLGELSALLAVDEDTLCHELREVHRLHHDSEHPFAAMEIPSVREAFPGADPAELLARLAGPFRAFDAARTASLHLYDGVESTLGALAREGVVIVGYTEAIGLTAAKRLRLLGVDRYFSGVYCLESALPPHPAPDRPRPADGVRLHEVPRHARKPNPDLLAEICAAECARLDEAVYVGDSLTRDVWMARRAGVCAVWARYGRRFAPEDWDTVVRVSHWTDADVIRETRLRRDAAGVRPDRTIDSFAALPEIVASVGARRVGRRRREAGSA